MLAEGQALRHPRSHSLLVPDPLPGQDGGCALIWRGCVGAMAGVKGLF